MANRPRHPRAQYFVARRLFDEIDGFADLEARIAELPVGDRGDAFEVFAEAYLATQKLVGAEEVWPANQVPIAVLQTCCLPIQDMGADGVAAQPARPGRGRRPPRNPCWARLCGRNRPS